MCVLCMPKYTLVTFSTMNFTIRNFDFKTGHLYVKSYDKCFQYQQGKECLYTFQDGCVCDWIPTPSSAPAQVETTNEMVTWEHFMCRGIVGDIDAKQDGTFQMYLEFLDG